ncbi:MAG: hypothetical protein KA191_02815 [Verrucomicrobia bacterium]|jgi:hypothetical protein|nr:hypothetical protein [Verrucomicrobiota bacterium]OQC66111.1 MAG: Glycosyl hydrolase family 71 [Verrucomicrobia bacterium ADurb.Bin006]MDI9380223.1 hypothetical protein [Verrucomicrobiota bacterium]NMD22087.1 hypothetical protein [Verrucomicrobiota bacterium]HNV00602.1 hypothetical protein [Verrucomicrobiota bacterium]
MSTRDLNLKGRRIVLLIGGLVLLAAVGSCFAAERAGNSSVLEFIRAQSERRLTQVPREVLAFYYTWYGRPERHGRWVHWGNVDADRHDISESTHYPALGAYDSHDPAVIDRHIDQAKAHGLTGFIATWWGQNTYDDRAFVTLLERAEKKNFKVTVYWETAPATGQRQVDQAINDLAYVLQRYGSSPALLKVEGKPVVFVYGRVMGQVPPKSWPAIVQGAREKAGDALLIADGYQAGYARMFDGVHTYNICDWVQGKRPDELRALSAQAFAHAVQLARTHGRISCLTVIPGYNDTKIRTPGINAERQGGLTYRVLWEEAIKADPDWVLITSWNEWHEGSEIEPSWEDGDAYLKLTGEYAPRFRTNPVSKARGLSLAALAPEKARQVQAWFAGKTVGLLPDFSGDAAFWLLDAGVDVRELTWADLLDSQRFNPQKLPLILHAGGEHYVRSVEAEGDVEQALQRYLAAGGFLVAIPSLPFPFFYDDAAGRPAPIASKVGLPVTGGWETPPSNVALTFHLNTELLPELSRTVAFPAAGDRRWRPAMREQTHPEDFYVSLARLKDADEKNYGDGMAYVEHRAGARRGGKSLYVWMRMPDVLGLNECLYAVFQFAAQTLGSTE